MSTVTAQLVKELRDRTGVGMGKCKEALEQVGGDLEKAIDFLRKSGMASAVKKEGRETKEGRIAFAESAHACGLVEVNAETDFVVKNERFQELVDQLAQQVAATSPASLEELLQQPYRGDPSFTVEEYRSNLVQTIGENIRIRRLAVFPKKPSHSVGIYSHMGGKLVTVVELSGHAGEQPFAKEIAMHAAAAAPDYLKPEEVPADVLEREREVAREQVAGKPPQIVEKIVEGKIKAFLDGICLECQKFIRDDSLTIKELVQKRSKELGGAPLQLTHFVRWGVGQG